jgi:hypothetical protein
MAAGDVTAASGDEDGYNIQLKYNEQFQVNGLRNRKSRMITRKNRAFIADIAILISMSTIFPSCGSGPTPTPALPPAETPVPVVTAAPGPIPPFALYPGDFYFSVHGKQSFLLSRNPTGKTGEDFTTLLDWAYRGGSKVVRVHLTHGWWGDPWINTDWSVNEKWARDWEGFFDQARADGIFVIPVFGVWADWNDGKPADFHFWQYNPLNVDKGGPLATPTGLFRSDSSTQKHWIAWVRTLVNRWKGRENIAAWEIFSEINLASGAPGDTDAQGGVSVAAAVDFANTAAEMIRTADASRHPVTLSLAAGAPFTNEWAGFYELESLDFIEIHPYHDMLDRELVADVRQHLIRYNKPVMIGESGLWSMENKANAIIGIRHAVWAGLVSGAMNGRAFWGVDGYAFYDTDNRADALAFLLRFAAAELPVANFTNGVNFSGFKPLTSTFSSGVWGASVGNRNMVLGWYRGAGIEPPDWELPPVISGETVTLTVPGSAAGWRVDFYDTTTGTDIVGSTAAARKGDKVTITLPDLTDDIAFKMQAQ